MIRKPLKTTDKVVVVAGGMPFEYRNTERDFDKYSKFLHDEYGLGDGQLEIFRTERNYYGMSDTPQKRAEFIVKALADERVKLMFDGGGNGTDEVIEYLKKYQSEDRLQMRPDVVMCGFSDGDQLLNYLGGIGAVSPVQALPIGALTTDKKAAEAMKKFLFEQKVDDVGLKCFNRAALDVGSIDGKLVIFNGHSRRAEYSTAIDEKYGSIVLLEATQQASRRNVVEGLQFALASMKQQNQKPKAILLSQSDLLHSTEQIEQIKKIAEESEIPIFSEAPFGHARGIKQTPLPLHTQVRIAVTDADATLSISAVRTAEDIKEVRGIFESQTPYYVRPTPVISEAISIPDVTVTCVYNKSGEEKKERVSRSPLISKEDKLSWSDVVKGVKEVTDPKKFLFARATKICQRCEVTDLDCVDLSGKNVMIDFEGKGMPPFQIWQESERKRNPQASVTQEEYEKQNLSHVVQDAQTTLMELLKTGQLQKAASLIFLLRDKVPKGFNDWLKDFAKGHDLNPGFFTGQAPENAALFPEGPPRVMGSVTLIETRMKVVEPKEESKSVSIEGRI